MDQDHPGRPPGNFLQLLDQNRENNGNPVQGDFGLHAMLPLVLARDDQNGIDPMNVELGIPVHQINDDNLEDLVLSSDEDMAQEDVLAVPNNHMDANNRQHSSWHSVIAS